MFSRTFVVRVPQVEDHYSKEQNVSETGPISLLRKGKKTPTLLSPLERANLHHWAQWLGLLERAKLNHWTQWLGLLKRGNINRWTQWLGLLERVIFNHWTQWLNPLERANFNHWIQWLGPLERANLHHWTQWLGPLERANHNHWTHGCAVLVREGSEVTWRDSRVLVSCRLVGPWTQVNSVRVFCPISRTEWLDGQDSWCGRGHKASRLTCPSTQPWSALMKIALLCSSPK
jgi:hypothetical protein